MSLITRRVARLTLEGITWEVIWPCLPSLTFLLICPSRYSETLESMATHSLLLETLRNCRRVSTRTFRLLNFGKRSGALLALGLFCLPNFSGWRYISFPTYAFDFDTLDVHSTASRLTSIFVIQVNYCRILKQAEHDSAKTGIQFSFSSPM